MRFLSDLICLTMARAMKSAVKPSICIPKFKTRVCFSLVAFSGMVANIEDSLFSSAVLTITNFLF